MSVDSTKLSGAERPQRKVWLAAFWAGGVTLLCCLAVVIAFPAAASSSKWIYGVALGSGLLCVVAAVQLRSLRGEEAAGDGAWLARMGNRSSNDSGDGADGFDD